MLSVLPLNITKKVIKPTGIGHHPKLLEIFEELLQGIFKLNSFFVLIAIDFI